MISNKIGVGCVTYKRPQYFKQCINSIPNVDTLVVVNDGDPYDSSIYPKNIKEIIQHDHNKSVGVSKNELMRYLIQDGCTHIFLMEDDMEIIQPNVFEEYIKAASASGIWHLNYGPGSPYNRVQDPTLLKADLEGRHLLNSHAPIKPRLITEYKNGSKIALYQHSVAMFTYFHRGVIKNVGYHDERFHNAWEHVELTYRIIKAGLHTPFWWFADLYDSTQYLREIEGAIANSSIANNKEQWKKDVSEGAAWYKHIHGHYPAQVPDTTPERVGEILKSIKNNYARDIK
jgi:GT2 family glycosyltransferase